MSLNPLILITLLSMLMWITTHTAMANDRYGKQQVVYQINSDNQATQKSALGNIQNHLNAVGKDKLTIKVVTHGNGLSLLAFPSSVKSTQLTAGHAPEDFQAKISGLKLQEVQFLVCANTLKGKKWITKTNYMVSSRQILFRAVLQKLHTYKDRDTLITNLKILL